MGTRGMSTGSGRLPVLCLLLGSCGARSELDVLFQAPGDSHSANPGESTNDVEGSPEGASFTGGRAVTGGSGAASNSIGGLGQISEEGAGGAGAAVGAGGAGGAIGASGAGGAVQRILCDGVRHGGRAQTTVTWGDRPVEEDCAQLEALDVPVAFRHLSADGNTLVGKLWGNSGGTGEWVRWERRGHMECLGGDIEVTGVSRDGSFLAASESLAEDRKRPLRLGPDAEREPLRLDGAEGAYVSGSAVAISADGAILAGNLQIAKDEERVGSAFTYSMPAAELRVLPAWGSFMDEPSFGVARDLSADGAIVLGRAAVPSSPKYRGLFWLDGEVHLLDLAQPQYISGDGSLAVGLSSDGGKGIGTRVAGVRTQDGDLIDLDFPLVELTHPLHEVHAINDEGSVVYGTQRATDDPVWEAIVWTPDSGARLLFDLLDESCVETDALRVARAAPVATSADGLVFVLCSSELNEPDCWIADWGRSGSRVGAP